MGIISDALLGQDSTMEQWIFGMNPDRFYWNLLVFAVYILVFPIGIPIILYGLWQWTKHEASAMKQTVEGQ